MTIKTLDLSGDPFSCGLAHGRALPREIADNVETYQRRFAVSGLARDDALAEGERWVAAITASSPDYAEEMRGVAEGAGISPAAVGMLNARYEIAFTLFGKDARSLDRAAGEASGCTTFGALPEATADGGTWIGQNWDWLAGIHGRAVVVRQKIPGKPAVIFLTEAGIVGGKMALNEHGIGLVENGLASDRDGANPYEKPFHVRCREVIENRVFDQALLPITRTKRVASANFVIGDAGGEIVDLETSPNHVAALHPRDGIITHSNHFLATGHGAASLMERIGPNTLFRVARLDRILRRDRGHLDLAKFEAAFADHFSAPNAICRHPDERQPEANRTMTVASVILDLRQRVMHVADGPPCENAYVAFSLNGPLRAAA